MSRNPSCNCRNPSRHRTPSRAPIILDRRCRHHRESAKATLLPAPVPVEAPAPASALARDEKHGAALAGDPSAVASPAPPPKPAGTGDAASKKDSNKDVPSDLWLPEICAECR